MAEEKKEPAPHFSQRYSDALAANQRQVQLQATSQNSSFELSPIYYSESEAIPVRCKAIFAIALVVLALALMSVGLHFKGKSPAYSFFFLLMGFAALVPGAYFAYAFLREWAATGGTDTQAILTGPRSSVA